MPSREPGPEASGAPTSDLDAALRRLLDGPYEECDAAAETVALFGSGASMRLVPQLAEPDAVLRIAKVFARLGDSGTLRLIEALEHPDPRIRSGAAQAIGCLPDERPDFTPASIAVSPLLRALRDPDRATRGRAARASGSIAAGDPDPNVAAEARAALRRLR